MSESLKARCLAHAAQWDRHRELMIQVGDTPEAEYAAHRAKVFRIFALGDFDANRESEIPPIRGAQEF